MGLKNCQITLDNVDATYFPGQVVSGKVEFNFNSTKKVRGIHVTFKGEAQVQWSESESHRDTNGRHSSRTVYYRGNETYFSTKYYIFGGPNSESVPLGAGEHVFPFTATLPNFLPSSFEGDKGYIRYTVKVTLDRPWKFDQTIKAAFTVISHLDCNNDARAREPATLTMEKHLYCLCCREGPITGVLKVPCTGYVSGQIIPYTMEIDNASSTDIGQTRIKLIQIITYHSQHPRSKTRKSDKTVTEFLIGDIVKATDSKTFSNSFKVPSLPPSNLQNCSIIDLEYKFEVIVEISGFHQNMTGKIPVTIGTIPLRNMVPLTAPEQATGHAPMLGWIPAPANSLPPYAASAPVDPYLLPPPSYEECQFGAKSILDESDSEYTRFNNDRCYAPTYPVYNFSVLPVPPAQPIGSPNMLPYPTYNPMPTPNAPSEIMKTLRKSSTVTPGDLAGHSICPPLPF